MVIFKYFLLVVMFYCQITFANSDVLKVGVVPQFEQRQLFRNWQPILSELEKITGLKFELIGSPKIPAFEKQFNQGVYDLAYMNPYHVLRAYESQGYLPLVRDRKKLKGVLVVEKKSLIRSVRELNNKVIAFPAPNALGASLLIRAVLTEKFGIAFQSKYVQTHSSVYIHVAKKLVSAGGGVDRTYDKQPLLLKNNLRIIYETPEIIPHPIVIHPRISARTRRLIKDGLLLLFKTKNGKRLFGSVPINNLISTNINEYQSLKKYNLDKYFKD